MKKRINGKIKKTKKKILAIIVILIFLLYFCLALAVSKRNYLYTESIFKTISSSINSFFINNAYSNNNFSSNVINSKIRYLEKENNSLRNLASIKEKNVDYVSCEIVNRTSKFWFDKVTINAGYNDKVKKNLPVINDKGLIGFITKTGKKVSDVKLLTGINENNMISVFVETENGPIAGMLSGYDEKENLFKISDITKKNDVFSGDEVVLSGYGNEAYKGIYVGKVVREETENYGLSRTLWIESNVNFDDLLFALVPIVKEKKMIALIILFIISLFLESLVPNMIREFIPFFMISSIIIASTCVKDIKDGFILVFIFGVFYDLFYTDLLFFHGFMFMLLFFLSSIIIDNKKNFFLMIFTYYLLIILYNIVMYLFTFLQSNINIISLINIVIKSLLINSLYFIFIYLLFVGIKCLISNRKKKGTY